MKAKTSLETVASEYPEKISQGEKKKIKQEMAKIFGEVIDEADEVIDIYQNGIPGLKKKIPNPFYENGDRNGSKREEPKYVKVPALYQARGIDFLLKEKRVLMAHEMGTGKTLIAVGQAIALDNKFRKKGKKLKTLIVCPQDMRSVWKERLHEYIEKKRLGNIAVIDGYSQDRLKEVDKADFIIAGYSAFAFDKDKNGGKNREKLKHKLMKDIGLVILDEAHNAKNPSEAAHLSRNVKEIADKSEYLCSLTGTPIFNTLSDAYVQISLLEHKKYPTPRDAASAYALKPDLIRNIFSIKSLRKESKDIYNLPNLKQKVIKVNLDGPQQRIYEAIYQNDSLKGIRKLQLIKKALLEPRLLRKEGRDLEDLLTAEEIDSIDSIDPAKYAALENLVEKAIKKGEKVVVFSPFFRKNVIEVLEKRLAKYGSLRMDGKNKKNREEIRKKFQKDKNSKVLITNTVAGEGLSLTAASTCIFLDDPYSPGQRDQMIKRLHRPGQKKDVNVYSLVVPNTVDQGVLDFLKEKQQAIDYVLKKGAKLSEEQKILLSDVKRVQQYLMRTPIGKYLFSPAQRLNIYFSKMSGWGSKAILKSFKKHEGIAREIAENYHYLMEDRVPANTSSLYGQIIRGLEKTKKLNDKVDLGSGPGILAHTIGEQVVSVDLNGYNFSQPFNKNKKNINATLDDLPLKNESFDLAVCSLALDQTSNYSQEKGERELALREASRILRKDGFYLMTLPYGVINEEQAKNWNKGLDNLGFKVIPSLTGYASSPDKNFQVYVAVAQKVRDPVDSVLSKYFTLDVDNPRSALPKSQGRRAFYNNFYLNNKSLEECLSEGLKKIKDKK